VSALLPLLPDAASAAPLNAALSLRQVATARVASFQVSTVSSAASSRVVIQLGVAYFLAHTIKLFAGRPHIDSMRCEPCQAARNTVGMTGMP
jgi:hypothetical protein